jgi:hypothetical protein
MKVFKRNKPRQTGKTSDMIDLVESLLDLDRNIAVVVFGNDDVRRIQREIQQRGNIKILTARTFDRNTRGCRFDTVVVDDYSRFTKEQTDTIKLHSNIWNVHLYITDTNISF